jgi:hypothetical protein
VGRFDDALTAYEHAARMPDADANAEQAAQEVRDYLTLKKQISSGEARYETNASPAVPGPQTNR